MEDLKGDVPGDISIDPLKLMGGDINSADSFSYKRFTKTKEVEDGEEWVKNKNKKWYKPFS